MQMRIPSYSIFRWDKKDNLRRDEKRQCTRDPSRTSCFSCLDRCPQLICPLRNVRFRPGITAFLYKPGFSTPPFRRTDLFELQEKETAKMASARRSLLLYTTDMVAAEKEVVMRAGLVTLRLSPFFFVASVTSTLNVAILTKSTATNFPPDSSLDQPSLFMLTAWRVVEQKKLIDTTLSRPIKLQKSGTVAIALLMDSDISPEVAVPEVLAGCQSLALAESSAKLIIVFDPYSVTGMVPIDPDNTGSGGSGSAGGSAGGGTSTSPPESGSGTGSGTSTGTGTGTIPPQAGLEFHRVPNTYVTAWPGLLNFNGKLYCFYQGFKNNAQRSFYTVYDGNKWEGVEYEIDGSVTTEGPSAVVFDGKIYCFKQGKDSTKTIQYHVFDGQSWDSGTEIFNTRIEGGPSVLVYDNKLYCFHQGWIKPSNTLWYNVFDGKKWAGDKMLDGSLMSASPSAVVFNNLIYCFYQGYEINENVLLSSVFNPTTGEWSDAQAVPNSKPISESPAASVVDGKIYLFHQGVNAGELYVNVSSDGSAWGEDTLIDDVSLTRGPSSIYYNDELLYFYQKGQGGQVTQGELWYRALKLKADEIPEVDGGGGGTEESMVEWSGGNGDPSLTELGYSDGYGGYKELAEAVRVKYSADFGYVVYLTKNTLLYDGYADEIRMCIQYTQITNLPTTFAEIFAAEGIYDQRVISAQKISTFPKLTVSSSEPSYTLAVKADWQQLMQNATFSVYYRAADTKRSTHLWIYFFDKRTSRWVETKGPNMSSSTSTAAPVPLFGPNSSMHVFYSSTTNGIDSLCYNILSGSQWEVEKAVSKITLSGSPSPVYVGSKIVVLSEGPSFNGKLMYTYLDLLANSWQDSTLAYRIYPHGSPSAVSYKDSIYCFHQGQGNTQTNKLAYSIWDKEKLTWELGGVKAESNHTLTGEPTAVVLKGLVYCFYQGPSADGSLWCNIFNGSSWSGPASVSMTNAGVKLQDGLSAFVFEGNIHIFFRGKLTPIHQLLFYKVLDVATNKWKEEQILPTASGLSCKPGALPFSA